MRLELTAVQAVFAKAASTLASVRQQYFEQQEELHDDKVASANPRRQGCNISYSTMSDPRITTSGRP